MDQKRINRYLLFLVLLSFAVRAFLAYFLELGNDEVYYRLYALFPALSHFDHPPMVGFFIQLFSLNLFYDHEFILRLSSIVTGTFNTILIFQIGKQLKDPLCGFYSAILYTCSIYCFIICGVFILPDTPLTFFWLLSIYLLFPVLTETTITRINRRKMLLSGIIIGLALLSKYTAAYLWVAALIYIVLFNRKWLQSKELYLSLFFSLVLFSPVLYWNYSNHFVSLSFQGERIGFFSEGIHSKTFLTELSGEIFYNNPWNFLMIVFTLYKLFRSRIELNPRRKYFLLLFSLPLIVFFLFISLFRGTLPHWSATGYFTLIILAGYYFSQEGKLIAKKAMITSAAILVFVLSLGVLQIKGGVIPLKGNDVTLDMYGWRQLKSKFETILQRDMINHNVSKGVVMVSYRWFPAAHLDYYVASPLNLKLYTIGVPNDIHEYIWINKYRGAIPQNGDAYCLVPSNDFRDPGLIFSSYFSTINCTDTIPVIRNKILAKEFYVFHLEGYNGKSFDEFTGNK